MLNKGLDYISIIKRLYIPKPARERKKGFGGGGEDKKRIKKKGTIIYNER